MTELVLHEIGAEQQMLELFCGLGTFTAHLAQLGKVDAFEGNKTALDILSSADPAIANITARQRDLFKHPLTKAEFAGYDLVLLDPPRDGARRQVEELAQAPTNKIIYVSCNPVTFARDGRILQEGGYQLHKVTPVDQFWHAHHVELVAVFSRW
jgi:SAM-dependent methyltransferases related to tRNA (uracil-5-)-methyltransferase